MINCAPADISWEIIEDDKAIRFSPCGVVSYLPADIEHKYCGQCHRFMDLVALARELTGETRQ